LKQLNPANLQVTRNNSDRFVQITELRSLKVEPRNYNAIVDKKFYLSIDFYKIDNIEFHPSDLYSFEASKKQVFTPQINKITLMMPPVPPLYQWNDVPKVCFFKLIYI
jgi:hypothetical protein